jgi:DNA polymerase III epsilon subunit-like protein
MIILDVEASGLDPNQNSILSIGAFDFYNPSNKFYGECKVWDGAHINDEALAINGFTADEALDSSKQTDVELIQKFIEWSKTCKEKTFAGQNPSFDRDFLRSAALRGKLDWPFAYRTIDQHSLCYMHMIKQGIEPPTANDRTDLNSDRIMQYVGIPAETHPHNALNGAKVAGEAISRLLYDKKLLPEYEKYDIPWLNS